MEDIDMDMFDSAFEKAIKERDKAEAEKEYTSTINIAEAFQKYKKFIEKELPEIILEMINYNKQILKNKDTEMIYTLTLPVTNPGGDLAFYAYRDLVTEFLLAYELVDETQSKEIMSASTLIPIKASLNKLKNAYYTELQALPIKEQEINEMVQSSGYTK